MEFAEAQKKSKSSEIHVFWRKLPTRPAQYYGINTKMLQTSNSLNTSINLLLLYVITASDVKNVRDLLSSI